MKLDIEALAREAGFITGSRDLFIPGQSVRFIKPVGSEGCGPEIERLIRLIVERCADVCVQTDSDEEGPDCWDWHAKDYARSIRSLLQQDDYREADRVWTNEVLRLIQLHAPHIPINEHGDKYRATFLAFARSVAALKKQSHERY